MMLKIRRDFTLNLVSYQKFGAAKWENINLDDATEPQKLIGSGDNLQTFQNQGKMTASRTRMQLGSESQHQK